MHDNRHPPAADQTVVPTEIVVEGEGESGRAVARWQCMQSSAFDFGLDAAAAERARLRAVVEDEHRGAGFLRGRAARLGDGAPDAGPASIKRGDKFPKQFTHFQNTQWRTPGVSRGVTAKYSTPP